MAKEEKMIENYDIREAWITRDGWSFFSKLEAIAHAKELKEKEDKKL